MQVSFPLGEAPTPQSPPLKERGSRRSALGRLQIGRFRQRVFSHSVACQGWVADIRIGGHCWRMPKYQPIDVGVSIKAVASDLLAFRWEENGIVADFVLPDDDLHALRVSFDRPCIVRLLDEMPLSVEEDDTPNEGLVPNHFAYRLEGARFARTQSDTWKEIVGSVAHYQFVTGMACMDVLSGAAPSFSIVPRET